MTEVSEETKAIGLAVYDLARECLAIDGPPKRGEYGWEQYRHCTRKQLYEEKPEVAGWMSAYRCRFCSGYHVTSKQRTGRQKLNGATFAANVSCETEA
jgi:hypothetical protein